MGFQNFIVINKIHPLKKMSFTQPFLLGPVFFLTDLPCSSGYHLGRGVMQLHDALGINCKKGATTENQGACVKYMGKWVYVGSFRACYLI